MDVRYSLLIIAVVAVVGCGKKEDGNTGVVKPNLPSPEAVPEKLITDPIVEKAVRSGYSLNKPTGELTNVDLAKVRRLRLLRTKVTNTGLMDVAKLQQLKTLDLRHTKITDEGLKEVAKLQKLDWLSLENTQITDEGLREVAKLQKLISLGLENTQITDGGVAELKKALPNCAITRQ